MRNAFAGCNYGFFFHFLNTGAMFAPPACKGERKFLGAKEWNDTVNALNVKKLAAQLHELQADYAFITVGQNSGFYCSPNSVYEREVGKGYCSERDAVLEFAEALAEYGIGCYAYTTCFAPGFCPEARKKLQSIPPWYCKNCSNYDEVKDENCGDPRLLHFQQVWAEIHREWSLRWGTKIRGWWVDGCYHPDKMHDFPDEPNGHSFCRALRAGNPDSVVAFNPGVSRPHRNYPGSDEDFTAGEMTSPESNLIDGRNGIDGLKYHILTYAGSNWGKGPLRGTGRELAMMTRNITDNGGVLSWDIPFTLDGIAPDIMKELKEFADIYRSSLKTFPRCSMITEKSSRVLLDSDSPVELTGIWHGKKFPIHVPCVYVPEEPPVGEELFSITAGGLTRSVPLFARRQLKLTGIMTEFAKGDWGSIAFARHGDNMVFTGNIREEKSVIGPDNSPWDGTGIEFFIESPDKTYNQYTLRSDGALFHSIPGPIMRISGVDFKKTQEGYSFTAVLPLPDKQHFLLEVYRYIGTKNGIRGGACLGGRRSGYRCSEEYAAVEVL